MDDIGPESQDRTKRCPYLKEVVMIFCEAYPVKKMVPLESIHSASHCFGEQFERCTLFAEVTARMRSVPRKRLGPTRAAPTMADKRER